MISRLWKFSNTSKPPFFTSDFEKVVKLSFFDKKAFFPWIYSNSKKGEIMGLLFSKKNYLEISYGVDYFLNLFLS